jgi:FKBP-type peptidyl-prolyl cis-trans isomerase FkpA
MKHFITALLSLTLFISCSKDKETTIDYINKNIKETTVDYVAQNDKEITDYITKNNLTAKKSDTGLYYVITEPGTGTQPTATSNVTVAYKGYFTNGSIFDQSKPEGISFGLNQVIKGWTEGIPYFKTGGSGILLVPAHLGYGNSSTGPIPGGSVLIFDVKLISVK